MHPEVFVHSTDQHTTRIECSWMAPTLNINNATCSCPQL